MKLLYSIVVFGWLIAAPAQAQQRSAQYLHAANRALTAVLLHDVFSPPVASRVYLYSHMAAYETVVQTDPQSGYASLQRCVPTFPALLPPPTTVDAVLASLAAFYYTAGKYVFSEEALRDSFARALQPFAQKAKTDSLSYNASLQYGRRVADSVIAWSNSDQYAATRKIKRYSFSKQPGKWVPTPPAYIAAIEPYWQQMRTVTTDSAAQYAARAHNDYSVDSASAFYKKAYEVYAAVNTLTPEQRLIANYWDCNPFNVNTAGHLQFARKKLSPGGHWMNIAKICCEKKKAPLAQSAAVYVSTAIALYDAFIACWYVKYRDNTIRPETFINAHIDAQWKPVLQTPPFPEFPSGHSVVSTAAAVVLTHFFGAHFSFTDDTEVVYGLPVRHFKSINAAAQEAAISRLYGGIHYRDAIVDGQVMGQAIGEGVLRRIRLHAQ